MGRGSNAIDQLGSWAGSVTPKPPINAEKAKCYRPTDRHTDGQSGLQSRVHATKTTSERNKAKYKASLVACGWAGSIIEVTRTFAHEL